MLFEVFVGATIGYIVLGPWGAIVGGIIMLLLFNEEENEEYNAKHSSVVQILQKTVDECLGR